ncbi:MAG: hypothetical protein KH301_00860 [Brachyspira sp.]|uniref:hypothetical protein n=1 Tax=Candidatus Scatousia sp. TaxID=3085663 RepID=UPI004029ACF7|nr:hypothetical protein [Brachyspira sp.]
MILLEFFIKNKECKHAKVPPEKDITYCPDCGELIENRWFITRCGCCGVKLKSIIKNGEVVPEEHYCHNCGAKEYIVERVNKINFIDINYAVLVKTIIKPTVEDLTQSWVDAEEVKQNKCLLGMNL